MSCKKILILFLFLFSFSLFTHQSLAAGLTVGDQIAQSADSMKPGQVGLGRWTYEQISSSQMGLVLMAFGENLPFKDFFSAISKITSDGTGTIPKLHPNGAIGQGTEMIAMLFNPPASGIQYIASVKDELLGKPAYAQGFGFKGLEFLLPLWKDTRNIVYILSSIIFVVIGLMIILRVKVSPQAVVTVQSAIPQVITTLILVTFSYAIAGLIIDVGNLISGIVFAILFNTQGVTNLNQNILPTLTSPNTIPGLGTLMTGISKFINEVLAGAGYAPLKFTQLVNPDFNTGVILARRAAPHWFSMFLLSAQISTIVTGVFAGSVGSALFSAVGGDLAVGLIGALIVPIILAIMIAIWMVKLYFGLVKVYVTIIFKIIVAPLEIGMGAFPNSKGGFSSWILDVFANVMVFPIVMIFLVVINILTDEISKGGAVWAPGMLNSSVLFGPVLSACVGMAGLALISKLPDMIPQFVFMIKPSPFGQAIGENLKFKPNYATGTAASYAGSQLTKTGGILDETVGGSWANRHGGLARGTKGAVSAIVKQFGGNI